MTKFHCIDCGTVVTERGLTTKTVDGEHLFVCPDCGASELRVVQR